MLAGINEGKMADTPRVTYFQDIHSPQVSEKGQRPGASVWSDTPVYPR